MSTTEYRHAGRKFFAPEVYDKICALVAMGQSIQQICDDPAMPSKTTVYQAITEDPILSQKFAAATRTAVERRAAK